MKWNVSFDPPFPLQGHPGESSAKVTFARSSSETDLWWPNGYGEQRLYELRVTFKADDDNGTSFPGLTKKVGFRTVELVQDDLEEGLSFYFRINGEFVFAKGSNWIPAHVLPEKVTRSEVVHRPSRGLF